MTSPKNVAIIGRGIAGLTAAYHLVRAGIIPHIYGRKDGAEQASRAAQGVLCNKGLFFYESPLFQAKIESLSSMQAFLDELERVSGQPIPRFFGGVREPFWDEADFQATVIRVYRHRFWGVHGTEITGQKLVGGAKASPLGWLEYPRDGWFDPAAVLDALEVFVAANGAVFCEEKVVGFERDADDHVFIQTNEAAKSHAFDQIILASGAGTEELWKELGLADKRMFLIGGQTLRFAHQNGAEPRVAVKGNQSLALLPTQTILGSSSWQGFHSNSLTADAEELILKTEQSFGIKCEGDYESRSGVRIRFKDRMPLVGGISTGPFAGKVYLLTGFYKNGMHLAETCAREMLLDLTDRSAERRYAAFSPARFAL